MPALREVVIATTNRGKFREIKKLLRGLPAKLLSLADFANVQVEEIGETLRENAILKAVAAAERTHRIAIAEDSGLFVDSLKGFPGIFSARFAGPGATDAERRKKLLKLMHKKENRRATFKAVVAIAEPNGKVRVVEGKCLGSIAFHEKGRTGFGFGYDPIFIPKGYNKTFAELGPKIKNKISHRAKAFEKAKNILEKILKRSY